MIKNLTIAAGLLTLAGMIPAARGDEALSPETLLPVVETQDPDYPGGKDAYRLDERELRGIDVEPAATKIELENKLPDGSVLRISASPSDFHVRSSVPIYAPDMVAHGHMQDTLYRPSGSKAQEKKSAGLFYEWLRGHMSEASRLSIRDLTKTWDSLGVQYDYH